MVMSKEYANKKREKIQELRHLAEWSRGRVKDENRKKKETRLSSFSSVSCAPCVRKCSQAKGIANWEKGLRRRRRRRNESSVRLSEEEAAVQRVAHAPSTDLLLAFSCC